MAITQKTVVLNDFGLARRERTTSAGTGIRYSVSIEAQPMLHVFDAKMLGAGPALAIAEYLSKEVKAIGVDAALSTQLKRKYAPAALERGTRWAQERYSGGRTGTVPPTGSSKLFNDSGRFAGGIVASPTRDNQWVINVPANRLDPRTFKDGEAGLVRMFAQLRQYVPAFGDPGQLLNVHDVQRAIGDSVDLIFVKGMGRSYSSNSSLRNSVRQNQLDALREVLALGQQLGVL
jgi:hypothetical protein